MSTDILTKLTAKKLFFLHEHLRKAILEGRVQKEYTALPFKMTDESNEEYVRRLREFVSEYQFVEVEDIDHSIKYIAFSPPGPVITERGKMYCLPAEVVGGNWGTHHILLFPDLDSLLKQTAVTVRIDSGCFSGMVLGDTTCDCLQQLRDAQENIMDKGSGLIIEIPAHDGRGWGEYKMANQLIMDELGLDTIETAKLFYGNDQNIDIRNFDESMLILKALGFSPAHTFDLASANPSKNNAFKKYGFPTTLNQDVVYGRDQHSNSAKDNIQAKLKHWNVFL